MDCIIKIIKGEGVGQQFQCTGTEAVVGRSPRSQVRLSTPSASYEHAVITRNGDDYFIENLSAAGTYVNDERITGKVRLRAKDQLRFGADTLARVESVPSGGGSSGRRWLVIAVVAMLAVFLVLMVVDPFSTPPQRLNIKTAYPRLEAWTQHEVQDKNLRPEAYTLFQEAWRHEMSGDRQSSSRLWIKLSVLLAAEEPRTGYQAAADHDRSALSRLSSLKPESPDPDNDEMAAALVQFVSRMAKPR